MAQKNHKIIDSLDQLRREQLCFEKMPPQTNVVHFSKNRSDILVKSNYKTELSSRGRMQEDIL